jgi:hypothetical protein
MPIAPKPPVVGPDTTAPEPAIDQSKVMVKITVTKFGDGKISTGQHIAVEGDVMARRGDTMEVSKTTADQLEARGLAEIST